MNYEEILNKLTTELSAKRLQHSRGVCQTAVALANRFGANEGKAKLAGILHDCAKEITNQESLGLADFFGIVIDEVEKAVPVLLHAKIGAQLAQAKYGIVDEEIQQAIRLHTVGGPEMTTLDKIIYLADFIEPSRSFSGVEKLRKIVEQVSLDEAMIAAYDQSIAFVVEAKGLLHPATVAGRNSLLLKKRKA
ncbi:MAG: bis(5'-nucleosyl)-tetraphosphatase (symmetrical) YqeK [Pelosinus sp.]|nr:bis(5'-nucleosyl)-tetraphosphatase (symmetrical) YqeK [Pelosinus sp.]